MVVKRTSRIIVPFGVPPPHRFNIDIRFGLENSMESVVESQMSNRVRVCAVLRQLWWHFLLAVRLVEFRAVYSFKGCS